MNTYTYEQIEIGQKESFSVEITQKMLDDFRAITGDVNPLHNDETYAQSKGHPFVVAFGMLTASFLSTLAGVYMPGEKSLIHEVNTKMERPVYVGDKLTIEGTVKEKNDTFSFIVVKVLVRNQKNEKVLKAQMQIGISE